MYVVLPLVIDISSPSCLLVSAGNNSEVSQIFFGNFDNVALICTFHSK